MHFRYNVESAVELLLGVTGTDTETNASCDERRRGEAHHNHRQLKHTISMMD